jgi:hypothetical protein
MGLSFVKAKRPDPFDVLILAADWKDDGIVGSRRFRCRIQAELIGEKILYCSCLQAVQKGGDTDRGCEKDDFDPADPDGCSPKANNTSI